MTNKWIIWSIEHQGWWKPVESGYTRKRRMAGVYTFEKALEIVERANIGLHDVPNEAMVEWEEMPMTREELREAKNRDESDEYDMKTAHTA